jgi:hypothetical protein
MMHAGDMEVILARHFNPRVNFIVPNVFWGLNFRHELDLLIVRPSLWATEIEIKVTFSDLKADKKKAHCHGSEKIRELYFAVPEKLRVKALELIPENAGLLVVLDESKFGSRVEVVKLAKVNKFARRFTPVEIKKLGELAAMRLWSLKEVIYRLQRDHKKEKVLT